MRNEMRRIIFFFFILVGATRRGAIAVARVWLGRHEGRGREPSRMDCDRCARETQ